MGKCFKISQKRAERVFGVIDAFKASVWRTDLDVLFSFPAVLSVSPQAVENHTPQVIVIDEIGTELEALAARTIAQRGVQLVRTNDN